MTDPICPWFVQRELLFLHVVMGHFVLAKAIIIHYSPHERRPCVVVFFVQFSQYFVHRIAYPHALSCEVANAIRLHLWLCCQAFRYFNDHEVHLFVVSMTGASSWYSLSNKLWHMIFLLCFGHSSAAVLPATRSCQIHWYRLKIVQSSSSRLFPTQVCV